MKKVLRCLMALALLLVCSVPLGAEAASSFGERVEGMAEVTGVRISTHDGMTRIVMDADKPVKIVFEGNEVSVNFVPENCSDSRLGLSVEMRYGVSTICGSKYGTIKLA